MIPVILVAILLFVAASFAMMGLVRYRRASALARSAHERYMQFSVVDPFDAPRRYGGWVLAAGGHSPRAENVAHGRFAGMPLRAFDFRYEVGHGTGRVTRSYSVVAVETDSPRAPLLMWNDLDAEQAPLPAHLHAKRIGRWSYSGGDAVAAEFAAACEGLAETGLSVQVHGRSLLLCVPAGKVSGSYAAWIGRAGEAIERMAAQPAGMPPAPPRTHD